MNKRHQVLPQQQVRVVVEAGYSQQVTIISRGVHNLTPTHIAKDLSSGFSACGPDSGLTFWPESDCKIGLGLDLIPNPIAGLVPDIGSIDKLHIYFQCILKSLKFTEGTGP